MLNFTINATSAPNLSLIEIFLGQTEVLCAFSLERWHLLAVFSFSLPEILTLQTWHLKLVHICWNGQWEKYLHATILNKA